jgi:hypothetical protein
MQKVGNHTRVEVVERPREIAARLALVLPALEWRWHGIGVLQAYLYEGLTVEERVHIWSPSLVLPGMVESGNAHDHRFDLASTVVVGRLLHTEWQATPDNAGDYETYDFVHARLQTDENRAAMRPTGERFSVRKVDIQLAAGTYYEFDRGAFHSSFPLTDIVVTVIEKRRQTETRARVIAPVSTKPVPAFSAELTKEMLESALDGAVAELRKVAEVSNG